MQTIRYTAAADKALRAMPAAQAAKIEAKIDQLAIDPASLAANIKRLRGTTARRLRVDNYRVIYDDDGTILDIIEIGHRRDIYD